MLGWYDREQFKVAEYGSHDYLGSSDPNIPDGGNALGIMTHQMLHNIQKKQVQILALFITEMIKKDA
ncbi:MAG: hypothetical protein IPJ74_08525 [Saprospiraceae bacterium]|nr:hypothetical protein [Saprospiraceae bacterium]